jgi:hypothetical protein
MTLAEQWREIEATLPAAWQEVRLRLELEDASHADRAALVLGPFTPGRARRGFDLLARRGHDPGRILARLADERIGGTLRLLSAPTEAPAPPPRRDTNEPRPVSDQWDDLAARLPDDWSDIYAELRLDSSDYLERGALLLAPLNPARFGDGSTFRFRIARDRGYGTAAEMARRCFERLDAEAITGTLRIVRVLSRTAHVATQGPVWYVEGRAV